MMYGTMIHCRERMKKYLVHVIVLGSRWMFQSSNARAYIVKFLELVTCKWVYNCKTLFRHVYLWFVGSLV
jgi:hypothetical protein